MNKKYSFLALMASAFLWFAFPNDPPNGNTNAPGEPNCGTSCHTLNTGTQDGMVTITGLPALIEPSTAYVLTVTSTNPNGVANVAGFQLTLLNSADNRAGLLSSPIAGSAVQPVNPSASQRQYWEHNTPASYPVSNTVSWTATWTSPTMPANTQITAYIANNVANGNGFDTGDLIVFGTATGMLNGGGSNLAVSITNSTNLLCNGQNTGSATALATGGTTPYTYNWSNGGSGATINNLAAGTYTVTVTDNTSATATASVTITQPPALVLTAPTITNVLCNGSNTGSITAHASGGLSPYEFDWSNGAGTATISNLTAGPYTVTVTDDNGCTKMATYQVTQPAAIVINLVSLTDESCSGEEDGAITISVTGGVNPIFVEWSNGFLGTTITDLAPEIYSVTVTDNNDCTKTASFMVDPGGIVIVNLNQQVNVTCPGGSNGSISVTATGGSSPYTYNWSNGGSGAIISGLSAGSYILTATDSHGCDVVKGYTITQPQAIDVQIQQTSQNLCFGNATADLTSSATGGTSPFTSVWSNGVNGSNNSNLAAGTYTLTVTDDNGCTSTKSSTIIDPPQLTVLLSSTNETGVGLNNGTASASPAGGTGAFTYLWSNGGTTATITGLPPGSYTVTVTDANACSVSGSAQVNVFGCSLDIVLGQDFIICEGDTGLIQSLVTGESGNVTYVWSNGSTGDSLLVSETGEYCVTATDEAGCEDMDCIVITEIIITLNCTVTNESSPGANDGTINCSPGFVSYTWNTGATTQNLSGLGPGEYCVTVTDVNGCTKAECSNVQPGNCQLSITSAQTNVLCAGDSTGSITIAANNVTAPVVYTWSNGGSTAILNNLPAGNYGVTVSDATGCFATDDFIITEPDPLVITVDTVIDITEMLGSIDVSIVGGTLPYQLEWVLPDGSIIAGTEDLTGLNQLGNYHLNITDGNGCTDTSGLIFVDEHVAVDPTAKFETLKVYPVPAQDVLIVELENEMTEALITGIDGRLVRRIVNPSNHQLDVSGLESGWYMIRISDGTSWYIARIIK